jgi:hypothetical protein
VHIDNIIIIITVCNLRIYFRVITMTWYHVYINVEIVSVLHRKVCYLYYYPERRINKCHESNCLTRVTDAIYDISCHYIEISSISTMWNEYLSYTVFAPLPTSIERTLLSLSVYNIVILCFRWQYCFCRSILLHQKISRKYWKTYFWYNIIRCPCIVMTLSGTRPSGLLCFTIIGIIIQCCVVWANISSGFLSEKSSRETCIFFFFFFENIKTIYRYIDKYSDVQPPVPQ